MPNRNFWTKLPRPILVLAPMAGITDSAFRIISKDFGADVLYSEMVSVDGLYYDSQKTLEMLKFSSREQPLVIQLFGKRPELFEKAAKIVEESGVAGIDINFGCPARKVVAHGGGVTLMRDLDKCYEIIEATCGAVKIPVSVKIRTSINNNDKIITALDFIGKMKKLPVAAIMIHGRSYEQEFTGEIDFRMIKKVKKELKIPIIANGGINTPEEAKRVLDETGADGVGLARGVRGAPWLFKQVKDYLEKGEYEEFDFKNIKKLALKQAKLAYKTKGDRGIMEMRKHLAWYVRGERGARELRERLVRVESLEEIYDCLDSK